MEPMKNVSLDEFLEPGVSPAEEKRSSKSWRLYLIVFAAFALFTVTQEVPWLAWALLFGGTAVVAGLHFWFVLLRKPSN